MQAALARILLLQIFLTSCGFAVTAYAEEYDQFKLDLMLAKRGDPGAQFYVADAYEEGRGVRRDLGKAFEWYSLAAKNKHNGAQFKLAEFYENGWGVKINKEKAQLWYKKAERNGSRLAKARLARLSLAKKANQDKAKLRIAEKKRAEDRKHRLAENKARQEKARKKKERRLKQLQLSRAKAVPKKVVAATAMPDIMNVVLKGKWRRQSKSASLLPSALNTCLKTGEKEIVCFSKDQRRTVGNSQLLFTSKITLSDFTSNGRFNVTYFYNVLDSTYSAENGAAIDPFGLRAEKGWQEPYLKMSCQAKSRKRLRCSRAGQTFVYTQ